jgi:hypothetical protein
MPLGTAFTSNIVHRACTSRGAKILGFLKEERGGSLEKNRWSLVLEKGTPETLLLMNCWVRALVDASEISRPLGKILVAIGWNFWR